MELNPPFSSETQKKFKKNKQFQQFIEKEGRMHNYYLIFAGKKSNIDPHENDSINIQPVIMESINLLSKLKKINPNLKLIGGARCKCDSMYYGPLKIIMPIIDIFFIQSKYQKMKFGYSLLQSITSEMSNYFPFTLSKSSSGNIPFRTILQRNNYSIAVGIITMVKQLRNEFLYRQLRSNIEPWNLS